MKRVLSSIGIGNATVDTVLPTTTLVPGQTVDADVEIRGGNAEQEIDGIYFALATRYHTDDATSTGVIDKWQVAESFAIGDGDERTLDVSFDVPYSTPVSVGRTNVWLKTGLDIDWAVDPSDRDDVSVEPTDRLQALFDAADQLGLTLRNAQCVSAPRSLRGATRFVQEFEYRASGGEFGSALDELELVPQETADGLDVHVEVDRRGGLLSEMADADERFDRFSYDHADAEQVAEQLRDVIRRNT